MKRRPTGSVIIRRVAIVLATFCLGVFESRGGPVGEDSLFQKLVGEWEGRGELTDAEGKITQIVEKWTGKRNGENDVEMAGDRDWGEDGTHQFSWRYIYNPVTELVECEMIMSTVENPVRFEVQVNEVEKTITLRASLGEGDSELQIENAIKEDRIVGEVRMKDSQGVKTLEGTIEHRRPGKWEE